MKHFTLAIVALILLALINLPAFGQVSTEERQAIRATETHNEAIEAAEEQMEVAIERAKREYARAAITVKRAYIRDLQTARRTALQADNANAATAIVEEINRVQAQIEVLIVVMNGRAQEEQGENNSFAPFVGVWDVARPHAPEGRGRRQIAIFPDGRVLVVANPNQNGSDTGVVYQAEIRNGKLVVVMNQWTTYGQNGLAYVIEANDNGINCAILIVDANGDAGSVNSQHEIPSEFRSDITDELRSQVQPQQEEEPEEEEETEEENTFFGHEVR